MTQKEQNQIFDTAVQLVLQAQEVKQIRDSETDGIIATILTSCDNITILLEKYTQEENYKKCEELYEKNKYILDRLKADGILFTKINISEVFV